MPQPLSSIDASIFKAIGDFVSSLQPVLPTYQPLALYARLLSKTTSTHDTPVRKHIAAFTSFCKANRDAIYAKNVDLLKQPKIVYTRNVHIDIAHVFGAVSSATSPVVWNHILTIYALIFGDADARALIKHPPPINIKTMFDTMSGDDAPDISGLVAQITGGDGMPNIKAMMDHMTADGAPDMTSVFDTVLGGDAMGKVIGLFEKLDDAESEGDMKDMFDHITGGEGMPNIKRAIDNMSSENAPDMDGIIEHITGGEGMPNIKFMVDQVASDDTPDFSKIVEALTGGVGMPGVKDLMSDIRNAPTDKTVTFDTVVNHITGGDGMPHVKAMMDHLTGDELTPMFDAMNGTKVPNSVEMMDQMSRTGTGATK
jgi:hypothetical protein